MAKQLTLILVMVLIIRAGAVCAAESQDDTDVYPIDKITVTFERDQVVGRPTDAAIQNLVIDTLEYSQTKDGRPVYARRVNGQKSPITIAQLEKGGSVKYFRSSAIKEIDRTIQEYINRQGFVVVLVAPDPGEMDVDKVPNIDKRAQHNPNHPNTLDIQIHMGVVAEVRSVASGTRIPEGQQRVNNPIHRATTQASPVSPKAGHSLVRKDLLDDYVFYLNRHPGRKVDIAVSQANPADPKYLPGDIVLDYLIAENRPWSVVVQASNTGTAQTNSWRERFGFTNNQITNHDDIFSISYTTSSFQADKANSGNDPLTGDAEISYDAPFFKVQKLRWKIYGSYDVFTASDLGTQSGATGSAAGQANFIGEQENGAGELTFNLWQHRDWFVDSFAGFQYSHIRTNLNPVSSTSVTGGADVAEPYLGFRAERDTDVATTLGSMTFRYGMPFARNPALDSGTHLPLNEGAAGLNQLGRADVSGNFPLLQADFTHSFFLEPILNPKAFDPLATNTTSNITTRPDDNVSTLANEIVLSGRAQYSFEKRLIPQEQEAVGGLYSVRGYPESFVAGDSVLIGTAEYRLHMPRLLHVQRDPRELPYLGRFRWAPQQPYGRPDWDLIGRVFLDAGYARSYKGTGANTEPSQFLMGAGVGLEFQFSPDQWPTLDIRADYGHALQPADSGGVHASSGTQRFSLVFTLLY